MISKANSSTVAFDWRLLMEEISITFEGASAVQTARRHLALYFLKRATDSDFSLFDPLQIVPIVRSQCLAVSHLVPNDDKIIDRGLAMWVFSGRKPGLEKPFMAMLSKKSPEEAFKILSRFDRIVTNRSRSRAVNHEHAMIINLWVAPVGPTHLSICTNDLAARMLKTFLRVKSVKSSTKQSGLKNSLGLVSHRPPLKTLTFHDSRFPIP